MTVTAIVADDIHDWVLGDAVRLRQVLLNLVANGVKFTPSGSVTLTIDSVPGIADAMRFSVTDTGIGISAENLAMLFQRFAQADSSTTRRFGRNGPRPCDFQAAGLADGRRHRREKRTRSGLDFFFHNKLASMPCSKGCYRAFVLTRSCASPNPSGRGQRLSIAELIKAMLEQAGHAVVTVNDGAEAVRVAIRSSFDAILMDVQMPEMDGYAAARTIRRALQDTRPVPIIALTANALAGEVERCLEAGMDLHIPKPVNWPVLFAEIDRLVLQGRQPTPAGTGPAGMPANAFALEENGLFDEEALKQLRNSIGDQNTLRLMKLFVLEARQRFDLHPTSPDARKSLCEEAHTLGGSAGMLGFGGLAEACAALQAAGPDGSLFNQCLEHCRLARDTALTKIAGLIVDGEFAGLARSMA